MQSSRFLVDSPVGSDASKPAGEGRVGLHRPTRAPRDRRDIGVAGERPKATVAVVRSGGRLRVPPDRLVPAQPGELVEGEMIGQQVGIGQIEVGVDRRRGHDGIPPRVKPLGHRTVGFETGRCQLGWAWYGLPGDDALQGDQCRPIGAAIGGTGWWRPPSRSPEPRARAPSVSAGCVWTPGLTKRYFYESFASLAELQSAVVDHAIDGDVGAGRSVPARRTRWTATSVARGVRRRVGGRRASRSGATRRDPRWRAQPVSAPDHRRGHRRDGAAGLGPAGGPPGSPRGLRPDRHPERVVPGLAPGPSGDGAGRHWSTYWPTCSSASTESETECPRPRGSSLNGPPVPVPGIQWDLRNEPSGRYVLSIVFPLRLPCAVRPPLRSAY